MGNFRIIVDAAGGHGCQRDAKPGEMITGCRRLDCPDCLAVKFVDEFNKSGITFAGAKLIHWPETESEIVDTIVPSGYNVASYTSEPGNVTTHYVRIIPPHRIRNKSF